jgi:Uma2 family endonuclease
MEAVTTMPWGRELTRADLEAMPDDGHRYELLDGTLVVTPAPTWRHQNAVTQLLVLLHRGCPEGMRVLTAPVDVALADDTVLQPDLLVARKTDFGERDLPAAPLLAVEVLSPSTRLVDLNLKKARYEQAGCPSYWVVDPELGALTVWQLEDGRYVEVVSAAGDDPVAVTEPFPLEVRPAALLA